MPTVLKSGSLNLLEPSRPIQAYNGIALPINFLPPPFFFANTYALSISSTNLIYIYIYTHTHIYIYIYVYIDIKRYLKHGFIFQTVRSTPRQSLLIQLATVLSTDMSKSLDKMIKLGYVIASTAEAYMAPLAHSNYENLKVWSDKASQLLPLSWLALSFDGLLFLWCSVNGPLPKRPTCMSS